MVECTLLSAIFCVSLLLSVDCVDAKIVGRIMTFVDINADCFTDLVVSDTPNSITVYVASEKEPVFQEDERFRHHFPNNTLILNVGVGDFDGDSFPDFAVSLSSDHTTGQYCEGAHQLQVCYGRADGFHCVDVTYGTNGTKDNVFCEQPLVLDCNLDQRNDLLSVIPTEGGKRQFACLLGGEERGVFSLISPFPPADHLVPARPPSFHAFVDVTGDLNPELVMWTERESEHELVGLSIFHLDEGKQWTRKGGWMPPPPTPDDPKLLSIGKSADSDRFLLGQSVYDDFNKDGMVDHLLPFCVPDASGQCGSMFFNLWTQGAWNTPALSLNLVDDTGTQWAVFQEEQGASANGKNRGTFHVRSGDYTRDGYPDLLIVLKQATSGDKRGVFLLENAPCAAGQICGQLKRTFRIWWKSLAGAWDEQSGSITAATFFDLSEDGTLDVLLEYDNATTQGPSLIGFSASGYEGDTTFLKVQVFTATCLDNCRYNREGSAISLAGAALVYTSSDAEGNPIQGAYTQRPVAAYRSLLLPYALFGLGRTPNFVEKLRVGAPTWPPMNKSWEQVVPNSRIYVVPYPVETPKWWVHRLYLTPNRLIIYSFISLSSVCGLIIVVAFALHMQERRLDKKERELQREKFHFDAM